MGEFAITNSSQFELLAITTTISVDFPTKLRVIESLLHRLTKSVVACMSQQQVIPPKRISNERLRKSDLPNIRLADQIRAKTD